MKKIKLYITHWSQLSHKSQMSHKIYGPNSQMSHKKSISQKMSAGLQLKLIKVLHAISYSSVEVHTI